MNPGPHALKDKDPWGMRNNFNLGNNYLNPNELE